jgi:glycosyltransferase involved in cell wall biosynthesis
MAALWNGIARLDGHAVTLLKTARLSGSAYRHELSAPSGASGFIETGRWDPRRALEMLRQQDPHILVSLGHATPYAVQVAAYDALRNPRRVRAYCGDTNGIEELRRVSARPRNALAHAAKRALLSRVFTHALSLGWTNEIAMEALGLKRVDFAPVYCVDFGDPVQTLADPAEAARWARMAYPKYLVVARCVPAKNLPALLGAWRSRLAEGAAGSMTFVGDGPGLQDLLREAAVIPGDRLWIAGAREPSATRRFIASADYLVLPSALEPWGIVVVEALGAGIPCICSDRVGSAISLGAIAGDAILFTAPAAASFVRALKKAEGTITERKAAAARASATIRKLYGIEAGVDRLAAWGSSVLARNDR